MSENVLNAEIRELTGKQYAKELRREGKVPGVFYAQNEKPTLITLDEKDTIKILTSEIGLFDIQVGKKRKRKAIVKEVQTDPLHQSLLHVDIMGVRLKEKITVSVPVHIIGEAIGVKEDGGVLHQYLREIEVTCLPLEIPEFIDVDVTHLGIGDSISLSTISIENVEIIGDEDQPIVSILTPTISEKEVEEEEEILEEEEEEEETEDVETEESTE